MNDHAVLRMNTAIAEVNNPQRAIFTQPIRLRTVPTIGLFRVTANPINRKIMPM